MSSDPQVPPSEGDLEDVLLSCRYGDIEDVQQFSVRFGVGALADARDFNGNTAVHMACANGHAGMCVSSSSAHVSWHLID